MGGTPSPRTIALWQKVAICKQFPAYKLSDLDREPGYPDLIRALKLLEIAEKAQTPTK